MLWKTVPDLNGGYWKSSVAIVSLPQKVQDVNDLRQHLFDVRVGM